MKKVTGKWNVFAPESCARIYLAEEMGDKMVKWSLTCMARDSRGWVDLTDTPSFCSYVKRTKAAATTYASRVCMMIAHAEGRADKSLTGGGGNVRVTKRVK